jgi:hypothetical protein
MAQSLLRGFNNTFIQALGVYEDENETNSFGLADSWFSVCLK